MYVVGGEARDMPTETEGGREAGPAPRAAAEGGAGAPSPLTVRREWCKACGICVEFCPKKALGADDEGRPVVLDPGACSLCRICEELCPDFALRVRREKRARSN